ncbi:MAG: pyridoxamine 5'-phosphate oxidase family protein [Bacteroidales bacterium]
MKNRTITLDSEIERIIRHCDACNVAMVDAQNQPYVVPMNFGYTSGFIYLHSSQTGKKIAVLRNNNRVCVSFSTDHQLRWQNEGVACSYGMKYRSVLATGYVEFIEDDEEKRKGLDIIMSQYTDRKFKYSPPSIKEVCVFRVVVEKLEGRAYGY